MNRKFLDADESLEIIESGNLMNNSKGPFLFPLQSLIQFNEITDKHNI